MATIVVIDDEQAVRNVIVRALQQEGHEVLAFEDAAPALDDVNFDEVDLVITDLVMPTPGDQFILILRQDEVEVPVIVLSGYLNEDRIEYLKDLGVQQVLEKPLEVSQLLKMVREIV